MRTTTLALALSLFASVVPEPALGGALEVPAQWGPYSVELVDEYGATLPTFQHRGRTYVLGALGQRYMVRVRNGSWRRAEVVASVDGRDVIDGRLAAFEKRGYIVDPRGEVVIDGYRLSEASVAAFRFSSVPRSYAARRGDARDVGAIGVAIFPERAPRYVPPPPYPYPHPYRDRSGPSYDQGTAPEAAPAPPADAGGAGAAESKAAPGATARREGARPQRPGLGTEFGEEHGSPVYQVSFERASSRPEAVLTLRYDDREALLALGIDVDRRRAAYGDDAWTRATADPFRRNGPYAEPPPGWRQW